MSRIFLIDGSFGMVRRADYDIEYAKGNEMVLPCVAKTRCRSWSEIFLKYLTARAKVGTPPAVVYLVLGGTAGRRSTRYGGLHLFW
ncbi:MAG: hypothetical protein ACOYNN_13455, partial [Terrimicrobiaceae bacterium]